MERRRGGRRNGKGRMERRGGSREKGGRGGEKGAGKRRDERKGREGAGGGKGKYRKQRMRECGISHPNSLVILHSPPSLGSMLPTYSRPSEVATRIRWAPSILPVGQGTGEGRNGYEGLLRKCNNPFNLTSMTKMIIRMVITHLATVQTLFRPAEGSRQGRCVC